MSTSHLLMYWTCRLAFLIVLSVVSALFIQPWLPYTLSTAIADECLDCEQIIDGLIAWYPFNDNISDESGNEKDSKEIHGAVLVPDRTGIPNSAYYFDGINDYIQIPHPGYMAEGTIALWTKILDLNRSWNIFMSLGDQIGANSAYFDIAAKDGRRPYFAIYDCTISGWPCHKNIQSSLLFELNIWYHVAVTWGQGGMKLYTNGVLTASNTYPGGIPDQGQYAYLAGHSWNLYGNVNIDDVRIYNRALTEKEIRHLADRTGILPETGHQPFKKAIQPECADECPGCNQTPDGLVAWYPFDGNANDASGHGNHGMVDGARLIDDRQGRAKSAYHFDGVDDAMNMGDSPLLNPHDALTVSCWIYLHRYKSGRGEEHNLIVKDDFNDNERDYLLTANYQAQFVVFDTDNIPGIVSGGTIELLRWHHLVGTYDGSKLKLYVDGMLVGSRNWNGHIHDTETPLRIGETNDSRYERALNGDLDDVRIYNRALTDEEIQQLADRTGIVTETDHLDINNAIRPDCKHQPPRGTPRYRHRQGTGGH